jgi:hypothetical protein
MRNTRALLWLLTVVGIAVMAWVTYAHSEPRERYPSEGRFWPQPHYLPSWERTQRRYLPSYQYELERRKFCGNMCDDVRERRDPLER